LYENLKNVDYSNKEGPQNGALEFCKTSLYTFIILYLFLWDITSGLNYTNPWEKNLPYAIRKAASASKKNTVITTPGYNWPCQILFATGSHLGKFLL
jgi:hypothetical protein